VEGLYPESALLAERQAREAAEGSRDAADAACASLRTDLDVVEASLAGAEARIAELKAALRDVLRNEYDGSGLTDCIDNYGEHYQSQDLANAIARAESVLSSINKEPSHG